MGLLENKQTIIQFDNMGTEPGYMNRILFFKAMKYMTSFMWRVKDGITTEQTY